LRFQRPPSTEIGYLSSTVSTIEDFYVLDEQTTERPSLNIPTTQIQLQFDGIDSFDLNNLPQGTIITIDPDDETHEINDGELSFATDLAPNLFPFIS